MISKRNYLNHAQLIDSERDTMRNQSMISNQSSYHLNNPPILSINQPMISTNNNNFYRSPLRDRDNKINLSNTPLRSGKSSLSPLRMRKGDTSVNNNYINTNIRNTNRKVVTQERDSQKLCFNHPDKVSKFYVEAPDEIMYCCQKCAILLASQGFTVCKLCQSSPLLQQSTRKQSNTRKQQIQSFMDKLSSLQKNLKSHQNTIQQSFSSGEHQLQQQLNRIQEYYQQFYEFLNEHKKRVIYEMKQEYEKNNSQLITVRKELKEAIQETESMKEDILESWDDIIFVAEEHQYRPVIKAYLEKYQTYQNLLTDSSTTQLPELRVRKLNFINSDSACEALEKGLQMQWQDQQKQEQPEVQLQKKDEQDLGRYSKQSDLPENPVECLEKDEKFIKSSLKDLVGLFSSFEE